MAQQKTAGEVQPDWSDAARQAAYFDVGEHRYAAAAVLHPPYHAHLEVEEIVGRVASLAPGAQDTIIDFGAGSGRVSVPLLRRGYSVLAVDVSEGSLAELAALTGSLGLSGLQTATELPDSGSFKAIVGADILHHVDMDTYLPRMYDILAPGGRLIFSEPGGLNPTWYVYLPLLYDWSVERGVTTCTLWNLSEQLRRHGFRDVSITGLGLFPRSLLSWTKPLAHLNDKLGDIWPLKLAAYRYIVHATK